MNQRKLGSEYEAKTVEYLKKIGFEILETNFRCSFGEIDIIALDQSTICFIEVKYRNSKDYWDPGEAITIRKQNTIYRVAQIYLKNKNYDFNREYRFDVVLIITDKIKLIKNAFGGL